MTITIQIDEKRKAELEKFAAERGQSLNEIVQDALERTLRLYRFDKVRSGLEGYAQAAGYRSEDEILDDISRGSSLIPTFS